MKKKMFFLIIGLLVLVVLILSMTLLWLFGGIGDLGMSDTSNRFGYYDENSSKPVSNDNETAMSQGEDSLQKEGDRQQIAVSEFEKSSTIHILFLGIDRTEESDITIGVHRTDAIALAKIYLDSKKIKILRIPRDTYVFMPSINKMDKINHAYVWGGMGEKGIQSTIETINQFVKYTKVDYYFTIDMEPVPEIVDMLGGVDLEVDVDMDTHGFNLSRGFQHLDGEKAYQFISWRYSGEGEIVE